MSRATEDTLDSLHAITAETYLDTLRKYRAGEILDDDGNPIPTPAAFLASAARFLKDNGIDRAIRPGDPLDLLSDEMPEFDQDGNVVAIKRQS